MAVPATLPAGKAGKGISICMSLTLPVHDVEIEFQPPRKLAFGFSEVAQPGEGSVVCAQQESAARQVGAILSGEGDHGQQLSVRDTVSPLRLSQQAAPVGNDSLLATVVNL